jgi:hypothetical protein
MYWMYTNNQLRSNIPIILATVDHSIFHHPNPHANHSLLDPSISKLTNVQKEL